MPDQPPADSVHPVREVTAATLTNGAWVLMLDCGHEVRYEPSVPCLAPPRLPCYACPTIPAPTEVEENAADVSTSSEQESPIRLLRAGDRVRSRAFGELYVTQTQAQAGAMVNCTGGPGMMLGLPATELTLIAEGTPDDLPADVQAWAGKFDRMARDGARLLWRDDDA